MAAAAALSTGFVAGCGGVGLTDLAFLGLLFNSSRDGGGLFRMTNSGNLIEAVPGTDEASNGSMTSNGDVVFDLHVLGNTDVYLQPADGSPAVRLTTDAGLDFRPIVSPDGSKIVFISNRDGNFEVYVMDGDGSNETNISNNAAVDYFPSISFDATMVAFTSDRDGGADEIYRMDIDGTGVQRLTNNPAEDTTPAWHPDGGNLIFSTDRDGNSEIYRMASNGTNQVRVTNTLDDEYHASYRDDGVVIYFYAAPAAGGDREVGRISSLGLSYSLLTDPTDGFSDQKIAGWVY